MNIIFEHIPKTAGYTIRTYLSSVMKESREANNWDWENSNYLLSSHHILEHRLAQVPQWWVDDAKVFTFVRNPYERFLSTFFFILNEQPDSEFYEGNQVLRERLHKYDNSLKTFLSECPNFVHEMGSMWLPQNIFIDGVQDITIGRYETIDQDWKKICFALDIPYAPLAKKNVTHNKPKSWDGILNNEMKEIIFSFYNQDFTMFGYEK